MGYVDLLGPPQSAATAGPAFPLYVKGDGSDEAPSINRALVQASALGMAVQLRRFAGPISVRLAQGIVATDLPNTGLFADDGITFTASYLDLTNVSNTAPNRYTANSCLLLVTRCAGFRTGPLKFVFTAQQDSIVRGMVFNRCAGLTVERPDISGLCCGIGLQVNNCAGFLFDRPSIHDCTLNTTYANLSGGQLSGIEVDNDGDTLYELSSGTILAPRINRLLATDAVVTAIGYQTDGIIVGACDPKGVQVIGGQMDSLGEGMTTFADRTMVSDLVVTNAYNFWGKIGAGAKNCRFRGSGTNFGNSGCSVYKSDSSNPADTSDNDIDLVLSNVGVLAMAASVIGPSVAARTTVPAVSHYLAQFASTASDASRSLRNNVRIAYSGTAPTALAYADATSTGRLTVLDIGNTLGNVALVGGGGSGVPVRFASSDRVVFPAAANPSTDPNTFDDYREGTFTPTLTTGAGLTGTTYGSTYGHFTKVGRLVTGYGLVTLTNLGTGTASDQIRIGGLPFAVKSGTIAALGGIRYGGVTLGAGNAGVGGLIQGSVIVLHTFGASSCPDVVLSMLSNTATVYFGFAYITDA